MRILRSGDGGEEGDNWEGDVESDANVESGANSHGPWPWTCQAWLRGPSPVGTERGGPTCQTAMVRDSDHTAEWYARVVILVVIKY